MAVGNGQWGGDRDLSGPEPGGARWRFYQLYDKVWREDILAHAYALARANACPVR